LHLTLHMQFAFATLHMQFAFANISRQ